MDIDVLKKNSCGTKIKKIKNYMVVLVRKHLAFPNPVYIMFYFLRHSIYYHTPFLKVTQKKYIFVEK